MSGQSWQWQMGAGAIFLAWINLLLFIRVFPFLGIYVIMFTEILTTFCSFSIVFFLFIVAFALSFYTVSIFKQVSGSSKTHPAGAGG